VRRRALLAVIAAAVAFTGCSAQASGDDVVELGEFFITSPATIEAGRASISVTNAGDYRHTVVVTDASGAVAAATDLIDPGATVELDLGLPEGSFSFTCRIVAQGSDGLVDHFELGMASTVEVTG